MSKKVTFDRAPPPGTINFGVGQPSPDLLPVDLLKSCAEGFLLTADPDDLNYGERQGDPSFRKLLASLLDSEYGSSTDPDSLFVTAGNSQALDFVCALFTRPGDTVIVEEPSYFLAFRIFSDHGLNIVPVPTDGDGMDVQALELLLERIEPALVYTIPSYHNPGGHSMSADRREKLVALSRKKDFIIAADEVYQMLWYDRPPPPALGTMCERGNILSLGSFSKILAPGLRLGWIQTGQALMERLLDSGAVNSGGSLNQFTSRVVGQAIRDGQQAAHLARLRDVYGRRVEVMDRSLQRHFGAHANWTRPDGGYFFWLECGASTDTARLRERAADYRTGFQPGRNSSSRQGLNHCLRLSFARYGESDIEDGIRRLAQLFDEQA